MRVRCTATLVLTLALAPQGARAVQIFTVESGSASPDGYRLKVEMVMDAPPAAIRDVLLNICDYREQIPYLEICEVVRVEGKTAWSYSYVDAPVLAPRDYTIARTVETDLAPDGTGTLRITWHEDAQHGPPPREGVVRLRLNSGSWTIRPHDDGKRSRVSYQLRMTPGGNIPAWVARHVQQRTMPTSMALIEESAQRKARSGKVLVPGDEHPWAPVKQGPTPPTISEAPSAHR
ncbi:MAG: START domain-containing protein [Myxococcota bacterium]